MRTDNDVAGLFMPLSNAASRFAKRSHSALLSYLEDFEAEVREKMDVNDCLGPSPGPTPVPESRPPEMKLPPKDMPDLPEILWKYSKYKPYIFSYSNTGNFIEPRGVRITEVLLYFTVVNIFHKLMY